MLIVWNWPGISNNQFAAVMVYFARHALALYIPRSVIYIYHTFHLTMLKDCLDFASMSTMQGTCDYITPFSSLLLRVNLPPFL